MPIIVHVGHQHFLRVKNLKRIAIGNPEIVEVSSIENGSGILIAGKKRGKTDLLLWEGSDYTRINVEVTEPEADHDQKGEESLIVLLKTLGIKNPRISHIQDKKVVTGEGSLDDLERATSLLSSMGGILPALTSEGTRKEEILYDLKFLEISRGSLKSLGVAWPGSLAVDARVKNQKGNAFVIESSFGILIKNLISDGKAKILANPLLICEEGKGSSFLAGGEIPVVIIGDEKREVTWKKYGIILNLDNGLEKNGVINTNLEAEVSTIDHATGTSDIPGLITRRVKTSFSLDPGETVVLSGLVKNEITKDVSKLPLLGHLPIIGELFKSRNFRNNRSELIITITPTILTEETSGAFVGNFKEKFDQVDKQLQFNLLD